MKYSIHDTPLQQYTDMCTAATRQSIHLAEKAEQQVLDSDQLNKGVIDPVTNPDNDSDPPAITSGADGQSLCASIERDVNLAHLM